MKEELEKIILESKKVVKKKYEEMRYIGTGRILEDVGQEDIKAKKKDGVQCFK